VTTNCRESAAKCAAKGRRAHLSREPWSPRRHSKQELRRPDRSDDAVRQALASIQPDGGLGDSSPLYDRKGFPSPAQDACGPRDSSGHNRP